jgi:AraC-like DNA-binding protein
LFGCDANAFVIERSLTECPVPAADQQLYLIMKRYLDQVLSEIPQEDSLFAAVRKAIAESMRDGSPQLARVAKTLAMSPRTLQRRLQEGDLDFKKLVEDTRRRFAITYLKDRGNTLAQVAFLLGYSEVSAFNRAFKRWTGSTPLAYRRESSGTVSQPKPDIDDSSRKH